MPRRRKRSTWTEYVRSVVEPNERQIDVARRTGIDQTTVSRWMSDGERKTITSQAVAKFARAYNRPVLEAFVVAGFLTEQEAGLKVSDVIDWRKVTNRELLEELHQRIDQLDEDWFQPDPQQANARN